MSAENGVLPPSCVATRSPLTQTRDVASFTRVDNRDSVDVRLHVGGPQRVQVRAGKKVIGNVHTEVRDGTLAVTFEHHGFGNGDVVVEATVPKLVGIEASGSGDVDADGIDTDAFEVRSDGSASIAAKGTTGRLAGELQHFAYRDIADHLDTIDRYTTYASRQMNEDGRRASAWHLVLHPPLAFIHLP